MAESIADEAVKPTHNIAEINAAVVKGLNSVFDIDKKIDEAKAKHVEPLQEERKTAMRTIKADTNISIAALTAHYKLLKLYRNADEFLDEDAAASLRDDIKIVFDALQEGGQLDWVDVAASANAEAPAAAG